MRKKILVISGSPKKDGNTYRLVTWFAEDIDNVKGARVNAMDFGNEIALMSLGEQD